MVSPRAVACCAVSDELCAEEGVPSRLHGRVAATLAVLGLKPRDEVRTPQGYSLDIVVKYEGREVAIEVDGPSHFVGHAPTGATTLKRRQLRAAGWALLPVPYWEWDELEAEWAGEGRQKALEAYLMNELRVVQSAEPLV